MAVFGVGGAACLACSLLRPQPHPEYVTVVAASLGVASSAAFAIRRWRIGRGFIMTDRPVVDAQVAAARGRTPLVIAVGVLAAAAGTTLRSVRPTLLAFIGGFALAISILFTIIVV